MVASDLALLICEVEIPVTPSLSLRQWAQTQWLLKTVCFGRLKLTLWSNTCLPFNKLLCCIPGIGITSSFPTTVEVSFIPWSRKRQYRWRPPSSWSLVTSQYSNDVGTFTVVITTYILNYNINPEIHMQKKNCVALDGLFYFYLRDRERDREREWGRGAEGETERILSRSHAQCRGWCGAWSHDPGIITWAEIKSWMLNWLTHPGT